MRFRDRGAGALLMLALLLFMAGALSRFVPETWPGAVVPRFAETIAPWLLIWALLVALLARLFGARRGGGVLATTGTARVVLVPPVNQSPHEVPR